MDNFTKSNATNIISNNKIKAIAVIIVKSKDVAWKFLYDLKSLTRRVMLGVLSKIHTTKV